MLNKVLVICGATATGKTSLAVDCAEILQSQVISADSQLVYRGLNIGTAKPTRAEMRGIAHHMIDIADAHSAFSVADYREMALPIIDELLKKDNIPIICGGTGFYINSLLFDYSYASAQGNENIRLKYQKILEEKGNDYLYGLLAERDKPSSEKIHPNDTKRVIRALEIFDLSGKRKSELNDGNKKRYNYLAVAIDFERETLYSRIDARVDEMFEKGLVDEVKKLMKEGLSKDCQCMQAIGYKEVIEGLENNYLHSTICDIIKRNTRHYAKRQITFFKKLPGIIWLKPEEATSEKIMELLNGLQ